MYCNTAMSPEYIRLLTLYMRLGPWGILQGNFKETVKPEMQVGHIVDIILESFCEKQSRAVGTRGDS